MYSFYVQNFGCRATQADGASIERQLEEQGLARADSPVTAQTVVLNTCTVTASADQDARAAIRRIHRENPDCRIVVTGCYAQRAPEEIAALPGVSKVIGNSHKHRLAEILRPSFVPLSALRIDDAPAIHVSDIFAHTQLLAAPVFDAPNQRTRPNLKVQDGCDNRCSFCVIPSVRGQNRSLPLIEVVREVNGLVDAGYREVVISGINLGRWGRDFFPQLRFEDLVRAILSETSVEKLRISSVEPMDWSDELIGLFAANRRIARHAHVPMQSGSDAVLRRMHRKYRPWHYREKIDAIRQALPDAAIGADVMTGFPGETEAEFAETREMIANLPLTYLHVFTYSARPGTPAAEMAAQIPVSVGRERTRILRRLSDEKRAAFMATFAGKTVQAITLGEHDGFSTQALTDNYLRLEIEGIHGANQWLTVKIRSREGDNLVGVL